MTERERAQQRGRVRRYLAHFDGMRCCRCGEAIPKGEEYVWDSTWRRDRYDTRVWRFHPVCHEAHYRGAA